MSDYSLVYFFGGQNAKKTDLGPATIKAGLMPDNNIIVPRKYKFVSRYHAEFLLIKGMPHIKDISKNGTWVNDKKLDFNHEIKLKHQDEIRLLPTHEPNHEELILTFIDLTEIMGTAPTPPITNNDGKPEEVKGSHYISHHGGEFYYDDNQMIPFKYTAKSVFKHVYENNGCELTNLNYILYGRETRENNII